MTQKAKINDTEAEDFRLAQSERSVATSERAITRMAQEIISEVQGAIVLARRFPRNELGSYTKLIESMKNPSMAKTAIYSYKRAGRAIEGGSIHMAKEAAKYYGNMRTGHFITNETFDSLTIEGFCWDLENNYRYALQDTFKKLVQRKQDDGTTAWVTPDERDMRELQNRRGAILVRNCIFAVVPKYFEVDAFTQVKITLTANIKDPGALRKALALKLSAEFGVSVERLNKYIGYADWTPDDLVTLDNVYQSLAEGLTSVKEVFDFHQSDDDDDAGDDSPKPKKSSRLKDKVGKRATKVRAEKQPESDKSDGGSNATEPSSDDGGAKEAEPGGDNPSDTDIERTKAVSRFRNAWAKKKGDKPYGPFLLTLVEADKINNIDLMSADNTAAQIDAATETVKQFD